MDEEALASYVDPENSLLPRNAIREAVNFIANFKLAGHVWLRNSNHGAVGQHEELMVEYNSSTTSATPLGEAVQQLPLQVTNANKCWARRFRRRMGCRVNGVIEIDKGLKLADMQEKA